MGQEFFSVFLTYYYAAYFILGNFQFPKLLSVIIFITLYDFNKFTLMIR